MSIKVKGADSLQKKMRRMPSVLEKAVRPITVQAAEDMRRDMLAEIRKPKSGKEYVRAKIRYRASAAGQAPAAATGALIKTIQTDKRHKIGLARALLRFSGIYRILEYGTRSIAPRPLYGPAFKRSVAATIPKIEEAGRNAMAKTARGA